MKELLNIIKQVMQPITCAYNSFRINNPSFIELEGEPYCIIIRAILFLIKVKEMNADLITFC